jgi:hypothetical protein
MLRRTDQFERMQSAQLIEQQMTQKIRTISSHRHILCSLLSMEKKPRFFCHWESNEQIRSAASKDKNEIKKV